MIVKLQSTLACVLSLALCTAAHAAEWVATWGAAPLPPSPAQGPFPATPAFDNQTIRQTVRVSAGGQRIRVRFTNEYGTRPLVIGAARVALVDEKGTLEPASERRLLFSGQPTVTIPAGAPFLSDPVDLPVQPLGSLSISLYVPQNTGPCTCHTTGMQTTLVSDSGDFSDRSFTPKQTLQVRAFISGVEVQSAAAARAVVVLGDSISDGIGSSLDTNQRWPDLLANRLEAKTRHPWGVVNMGISGNRLLDDGAGQSALARFDRDVLSAAGVRAVIIFIGVNDLGLSFGHLPWQPAGEPASQVTPESMIAGYRQLIARAHARGLKVLGATITPYEGAAYYAAQGEGVRQAINSWIRTGRELDGVIDFDAVIRDPAKPGQIQARFTADHLHGNDASYAAMAAAIDLSQLD
jgi:lysophospholipase L1-like esterase